MKGITRSYLLCLIKDQVKLTIRHRRNMPRNYFGEEAADITEEELMDFIISIPYFTEELKDFLMENLPVQMIIISQQWEKDFVRKAVAWATDARWTAADMSFLSNGYRNMQITDLLSMPY